MRPARANEKALPGLRVDSVSWKSPQKTVRLTDGQVLPVSISSCVGEGDEICEQDGSYFVRCLNGNATLLPLYLKPDTLKCGGIVVPIKVKEIETETEFESFQQLSEFHYRGHRLHGRTAALIATTDYPLLPKVLGYIQLATPFYMNKCRATVMHAPFKSGNVEWQRWDKATSKSFINVFVRIARTVVHPEFRGLGLGQLLVRHACIFAAEHWQVARLKPLFLEIVADMLKYVPFSERAGMHYIGQTEGNLHRVAKDMKYLISRKDRVHAGEIVKEDSVGVVDLQVGYMNKALSILKKFRIRPDDLSSKLESIADSMTLEDYDQLQSILRLPKPTHMCGLSPEASTFLNERLNVLRPRLPAPIEILPISALGRAIVISNLSLSYESFVARTRKVQSVQKAFGVSSGHINNLVIKNLNLTIQPREIVLICGASGSGKTSLLDLLRDNGEAKASMVVEGKCFVGKSAKIGMLQPTRSTLPIIQLVGGKDTQRALHVLNIAGLTEAFLYFKNFSQLSAGQRYRLMLARLIDSGANLWLADEFCSTLDEVSASIVAHNLQRHARRIGATVVVAAPHFETFIRSLKPDRILKLTSAWEWRLFAPDEFLALAADSKLQGKLQSSSSIS